MRTLEIKFPKADFTIDHKQPLALLGSCFSDEISSHFILNGFDTYSNPLGTIFHPLVISRFLNDLCLGTEKERTVLREDVWLSWDAGSATHAMSEEELVSLLQSARNQWREKLSKASVLFVTFGTAWEYQLKETNLVVANCHKFPSALFQRSMTSSEVLLKHWKETIALLQSHYPQLRIIFTVSPVRHSKEGLIENNRSKAELIRLVAELQKLKNCSYFPSYELVIDVLRDYRYFDQDLVHPSVEAIQFVWEQLERTYFNTPTLELAKQVRQIKMGEEHRIIHPKSQAARLFKEDLLNKKNSLFLDFPYLKKWS